MSNWRRVPAKVMQVLGLVVLLFFVAGKAVFASGVPATWRLRRVVRSKAVRQAREEAEEQLRARLSELARTHELRPVLSQAIDSCRRGSRLGFIQLPHATPGIELALTGHLRIIAYFAPSAPIEQAVPELIERLPTQPSHHRDGFEPKPDPVSPGPHRVHDGQGYGELDWDIPGDRLMTAWQMPRKGRRNLREHVSTDPAGTTLEQAREVHGPLVAWILTATYYEQPKTR
ncbi:hypothetical protein GCM10018790_48740 [Kitasatospora xanthocidica]|uniref:hypothetical protein n=1 Tax=Kitasatospora xanthocidica TaxID=83382 RepID=UPI001673C8EC|nr:hypothetical protein [Kitasatospora xanthocidica]GHF65126.1 hypothetical protein GCM10018790_48740 [Kitasatospora xanthocidica]